MKLQPQSNRVPFDGENHAERRRRLQLEERKRAQQEREERETESLERKRREAHFQEEKNKETQRMEREQRQSEQLEQARQRSFEEQKRKEQFDFFQQKQDDERKRKLQQRSTIRLGSNNNVHATQTTAPPAPLAPLAPQSNAQLPLQQQQSKRASISSHLQHQEQHQEQHRRQEKQHRQEQQQHNTNSTHSTHSTRSATTALNFAQAFNNAKKQKGSSAATPASFATAESPQQQQPRRNPGYDWASSTSASEMLQTSPTVQAHINEARQRRTQWELKDPKAPQVVSSAFVHKVKEDRFQRNASAPFATEQSLKVKLESSAGLQTALMQLGMEKTQLEASMIRLEPKSRRKMDARLEKERIEIRLGVIRKESMSIKKQLRIMGM